ncbi:MAG: hypothetical protein QOF76_1380 [Solirubrobacteraceae bacterium]|nr:hypothetical protein [Solirubrobacteraceae bacterium]
MTGVAALPFAALAWAAADGKDRIPEGVTIGGTKLSGMTRGEAINRLSAQFGTPVSRAVTVTVDGGQYRLSARRAGVRLDIEGAVDRAIARGTSGSFVNRGWRELTGKPLHGDEPVTISVNPKAIVAFVDGIAADVGEPVRDSELSISVASVMATDPQDGRELADKGALEVKIAKALRSVTADRDLLAHTEVVKPTVTAAEVLARTPTVVTVSHDEKTVRVFDGGQVVQTYTVAVGDPTYPTPTGRFAVQSMQIDPDWNVPNSTWAGDLAGKTIPGGSKDNPLVARWIGFDGSVGFHGTRELDSLGTAASHGCVRMDPKDVKDLYTRVQIGTPVYVGA